MWELFALFPSAIVRAHQEIPSRKTYVFLEILGKTYSDLQKFNTQGTRLRYEQRVNENLSNVLKRRRIWVRLCVRTGRWTFETSKKKLFKRKKEHEDGVFLSKRTVDSENCVCFP